MKEIFDTHFRRIVLFCNSITKNMEDAEDIAIDTFVELWKHYDESNTNEQIKAFLFLVSKRKCLNHIKKARIRTCEINDALINYADINSMVIDSLHKKISEEVEQLPWRQRDVARLILFGFDAKQIAMKLGIDRKTVFNTKYVVINTLKQRLEWYIKEYVYLD